MIDFDLTDEQRLLQESMRQWRAGDPSAAHPRSQPRAALDPSLFAAMASRGRLGSGVLGACGGNPDDHLVGRFDRDGKGAVIDEGTREIHKIMQVDDLLGDRVDRPTRGESPAWRERD